MDTREIFKKNLNRFIEQSGKNKRMISYEMKIPYTTLAEWANGNKFPRADGIEKLANYFKILKSDLLEESEDVYIYDNISPIRLKKFPMLGNIACGEPIWADEDKESYVMADMDISADFCLTAKGDSMINARIYDGDIVFIRKMPIVNNGEIAAVIIDDEATLKRWYYYKDDNKLMLVAENPKYPPLVYINEELNNIRCLGKAVYFMSAL